MQLLREAEHLYEEVTAAGEGSKAGFSLQEVYGGAGAPRQREASEGNGAPEASGRVYAGDNSQVMAELLAQGYGGRFQLIYMDPPFYSKADYKVNISLRSQDREVKVKKTAYRDSWDQGFSQYLRMIALRIMLARDLLSDQGCLWVHLDWHAAHYVKLLLDEIMGEDNFVNEVIWCYKSGGATKRRFSRKHDTLLFYGKTRKYYFKPLQEKSYNRGLKPYAFKGVKEYQDEKGWYTLVNMKDVWNIDMVGRTSSERVGYATQKPEALIQRIVESCSREGDLCADFFGGSGTFGAVCGKMGRKWICADKGQLAIAAMRKRFASSGLDFEIYSAGGVDWRLCGRDQDGELNQDQDLMKYIDVKLKEDKKNKKDKKSKILTFTSREAPGETLHPLETLDFWSLDTCHKGKEHKSFLHFTRDKHKLNLEVELTEFGEEMEVLAVDVFGHVGRWKVR